MKIKNRNSCYFYQLAERLTNLTVSVSESVWPPTSRPPAGSDFKKCYHHIGPVDVYVNFTCTSVAVGRYLYITIMINEPHVLTLCDVRVYGEAFSKYIASVLDIHSTYLTGCVTNHISQSWFYYLTFEIWIVILKKHSATRICSASKQNGQVTGNRGA